MKNLNQDNKVLIVEINYLQDFKIDFSSKKKLFLLV